MKKLMYLMVLVTGGLVYMRATGMLTPDGYVKFNGASIPVPGLANGAGVSSMIGAAMPLATGTMASAPETAAQTAAARPAAQRPPLPMATRTYNMSATPTPPAAAPAVPSVASMNPLTGGDPFAAVNRAMRDQ